MSYNGSGQWNKPTGQPVTSGSTISSTTHNTLVDDIATALSMCVLKDGQQTITNNIPFNSNKITGLASGTSTGDAVAVGDNISGLTNDAGYVTIPGLEHVTETSGGELTNESQSLYNLANGAANFTLPEVSTVDVDDQIILRLFTSSAGTTGKVQVSDHANDGGALRWIGTTVGDYVMFQKRGSGWFVIDHYESIYLRVSVNADEAVAQGTSEQITSLTADVDNASLWDGANNEVDVPLDALLTLHWEILSSGRDVTPEAKVDTTYLFDASAGENPGLANQAGAQVLSLIDIQVDASNKVELWAHNMDTNDGSQSVLGDAAGDESQATIKIRWRY